MALTFKTNFNEIQAYKSKGKVKYVIFQFDLDSMTLILKLDPDMVLMYLKTENEIPSYSCSKVIAQTDT